MELLHGWAMAKGSYRSDQIPSILNGRIDRERLEGLARAQLDPKLKRPALVAEFVYMLRELVDQWIASGKTSTDPEIDNAHERKYTWVSSEYKTPIVDHLVAFAKRHQPRFFFIGERSVGIYCDPHYSHDESEDAALRARDQAVYLFFDLLDSPNATRIYRCTACGRYGLRERTPKANPIAYGAYCDRKECRIAASEQRNKASLRRKQNQLIDWAVEFYRKYDPSQSRRFGTLQEFILKGLNSRLQKHRLQPRKINWVSRHWEEIIEAAERTENVEA